MFAYFSVASHDQAWWTGGLVFLSTGHILLKSVGGVCVFSWNEAEFTESSLCVCVSPVPSATAVGRVLAGAGEQCLLCLRLLGPYVSMNHNFGPISSALSPPGLSVPDGLNLGGCFGTYSGWRFGHLFLHPWRHRELWAVPCGAGR